MDGDVVKGKIKEMVDSKGKPRFGCSQPLTTGNVITFDPHRRHAVLPWKELRIVLVGYTPGVPQNLRGPEREILGRLGFPIPAEVEAASPIVSIRALSAGMPQAEHMVQEEDPLEESRIIDGILTSDGTMLFERQGMVGDVDTAPGVREVAYVGTE